MPAVVRTSVPSWAVNWKAPRLVSGAAALVQVLTTLPCRQVIFQLSDGGAAQLAGAMNRTNRMTMLRYFIIDLLHGGTTEATQFARRQIRVQGVQDGMQRRLDTALLKLEVLHDVQHLKELTKRNATHRDGARSRRRSARRACRPSAPSARANRSGTGDGR